MAGAAAFLALLFATANPVVADDITSADTRTNTSASEPAAEPKPVDPTTRQRTIAIAIWALIGIAFVGLMLLVATMFLGARARRIARAPLPVRTPDDAFTHLKKPPPPASPTSVGEGEPDDDEATES